MSAVNLYLILSAVGVLLSNNFYPVFKESYSLWLVPVLFLSIFVTLVLLQFITVLILVLTTSMKKNYSNGSPFFRFLIKHSLPIAFALLKIKIDAKGVEKYRKGEKMLFVCNHQQEFDPAIIMNSIPEANISFIGKKDILTKMKFVAKAMHRMNCLFIDRENDREAAKTIVTAIRNLKEGPCSIGLFPEGYCSKTCELLPLRNGSLKIATKTGVPIAVCVLNNTRAIPKNFFRRTSNIDFRLVDIIEPEDYKGLTTTELGNKIYDMMLPVLTELRAEK